MSTIRTQIRALREMVRIPWRMVYVKREIPKEEFEAKTIYVHIWVEGDDG